MHENSSTAGENNESTLDDFHLIILSCYICVPAAYLLMLF